jgi:hypothetical protein
MLSSGTHRSRLQLQQLDGNEGLCGQFRRRSRGPVSFAGARRRSSQPSRERRTHLKTRLAFNPCRRATAATDSPGASASATIRCRSSRLHVRRVPPFFAADIWCPPVLWWTPNPLQMRPPSDHAYRNAAPPPSATALEAGPRSSSASLLKSTTPSLRSVVNCPAPAVHSRSAWHGRTAYAEPAPEIRTVA